jgi:hypothetical protein|tara:strand:- start:17198 stop:21253 length:4056 start_codon:yes stop_codon:yes gene_type:complete
MASRSYSLEKKLVAIPLVKGMNTKVADQVLPFGELNEVADGQFTLAGEIRKRKGFHELSNTVPAIVPGDTASTVDAGKAIASYKDELVVFDGRHGYSKTSVDDEWVNKGAITGCTLAVDRIEAGTSLVQTSAHIAQANNFEVQVWSEVDPTEAAFNDGTFSGITPEVSTIPTNPVFVGGGNDDVDSLGWYTGTVARTYRILIIDDAGPADTYKWFFTDAGEAEEEGIPAPVAIPGTSEIALNDGVQIAFGSTTGHDKDAQWTFSVPAGSPRFTLNGMTDHNFSIGGQLELNFTEADWTDEAARITAVPSKDTATVEVSEPVEFDPAVIPAGGVATIPVGKAIFWRTYAKVIDKTTKTEVIAKTLINVFPTGNSMYNIPRAQVCASGRYVFIFVHVGSGRVKHTTIDTGATGAISAALNPSLLTNSPGETFLVDVEYPVWVIEGVNNASLTNGLCVFRHITDDGGGGENLRLSYFTVNAGTGAIAEKAGAPGAPVIFAPAVHFPFPGSTAVGFPEEGYVGPSATAKQSMQLVGDLMLKAVTREGEAGSNQDYISIGYTQSASKVGDGGSSDEPNGIKLRVYNNALSLAFSGEQEASFGGVSTAFEDADNPGYLLVNGTAGGSTAVLADGMIRFFLTISANHGNNRSRAPKWFVNAYDYNTAAGITDKNLNLHGCTVTTDCFSPNGKDLLFGVGYAMRSNSIGTGDAGVSAFNNSVGLLMTHQGEVIAKTATGAGPWSQEKDFRFLTYSEFARLHFMYGVTRVVTETPTMFRYGTSIYNGVTIDRNGTTLTAMDAGVGELDYDPRRYLPSVEANGSLKIAGGILWDYSGDYFKEDNFFWYPEIQGVDVGSGGDLEGYYAYRAVYEWTDQNGQVQQSNPSLPVSTQELEAPGKQVSLSVYTLTATYKKDATTLQYPNRAVAVNWGARSEVKIVLYRTLNLGGEATETITTGYLRCAEALLDRSERFQTIVDNLSDAKLSDNGPLYTNGGNFGNICPPSQYDIALWKSRVFLATTENTLWFSKEFAKDVETEFSDFFVRPVANRAEKVHGICPNLEHLLVFGEHDGYYLSGEGPNDAGVGASFSPLRIFSPGQGLLEGGCRVETPEGVFFQTRQGLMLARRDMSVEYKGAKAEEYISNVDQAGAALSTSANYLADGVVVEAEHEVRFTQKGTRQLLIYNYLFDQWARWIMPMASLNSVGSIVQNGTHYRLAVDGIAHQQQAAAWFDIADGVPRTYGVSIATGWISLGTLQRLGRVYRIMFVGEFGDTSTPFLVVGTDYDDGSLVAIEKSAPAGTTVFQLVAKLPKQKLKALQFLFYEKPGALSAFDWRIQSIALLVGLKEEGASSKLPTTQQIVP